jgi:hypothetical protein
LEILNLLKFNDTHGKDLGGIKLFAKWFEFGENRIDLGDTIFVKGGRLDPAETLDQIRWANRFRRDANCEMIRF